MVSEHQYRFAIIAGEHSGDLLGAGLIRALKQRHPNAQFVGVGGPLMMAEGLTSLVPMEDLAVMGLVEVLKHLPTLLRHRRQILHTLSAMQPDVFIGIDAPDFNLPIAKRLKAQGINTVQYVSPSVWAWRQGRITGIKAAVDHVLCLLPFEKAFYDQHQLAATFVGHPLADEIPMRSDQATARASLGLTTDGPLLALLPGSRQGEIARMAPVFLQAVARLQQQLPRLQVVAPMVSGARKTQFQQLLKSYPQLNIALVDGQSRTVMAAADAVLMTSGTVTLEAMLIKRPMVVAYRFSWLSYHLIKRLFKAEFFSLPNLLAGRQLVPELVQHQVSPASLVDELLPLLQQPQSELLATFAQLHQQLQGNANEVAATVVEELCQSAPSTRP
ncbi:lipid-A-disaccharide synthase [Idiomarina xiamenensis]|uniref:Lipid-A-disaccharide synthase n=1 Tax=Idiomarina xiamenensis 10-D-4 TaxID=740709 RepID=K2KDN2_9GAMM|nr:lipid-A-disaccharide synthase [Idiomarina xiamenensis]EKE84837.1 Lipid A disaccharide synthetase [Idiomarina xiamenensis 10-D-4]